MNRRLLVVLLAAAGCASPPTAYNRSFDFGKVRRVAVLSFSGPAGDAAADHLMQALLSAGADVVERRELASLVSEARLGAAGVLDQATVREVGGLLGVDAVFTGSVTSYAPAQSYLIFTDRPAAASLGSPTVISRGPAPGMPGSDVITSAASVGLSARMVDVETASVLWSSHMTYEGIDVDAAMSQISRSFVRTLDGLWLERPR